MRVLLISPPIMDVVDGRLRAVGVDAERECPPVGIYALAAALEAAGHAAVIADLVLHGTRSVAAFTDEIGRADLIGIGATSMAWPTAADVIRQLRALRADVPIVCGGIHPSLFDRYVLATFPVEFVVRGEGEAALLALCAALAGDGDLSRVPNLSFRDARGQLVRNPQAALIPRDRLGELPLPDYGRLPAGAYKCLGLESSRGCAFDCSFCSTPHRKSWRGLAAEAFVDRLERVLEHTGRTRTGCVHIVDDEFSLNPTRALAVAESIARRGLRPRLLYDSRAPDLLHAGLVERLAPYTVCLLVGAECGYDEGLARVGKGTTCATLEAAARELARHGIADRADFSFILGLPWESAREVMQTLRFATHLFTSYGVHVMLQWYRQIPGSRIWEQARRDQLVHEAMYDGYGFFRDLYLFRSSCRLSPREIYEVADVADKLRCLAELAGPGRPSIVHHFPTPIAQGFPRELLEADDPDPPQPGDGLARPHRKRGSLPLEGTRS